MCIFLCCCLDTTYTLEYSLAQIGWAAQGTRRPARFTPPDTQRSHNRPTTQRPKAPSNKLAEPWQTLYGPVTRELVGTTALDTARWHDRKPAPPSRRRHERDSALVVHSAQPGPERGEYEIEPTGSLPVPREEGTRVKALGDTGVTPGGNSAE